MPRTLRIILAAVTLLITGTGFSAPDDAAAVVDRDRQLNERILAHDVSAAAAFYTDDFLLTTSSGRTKTKSDMLTDVGSPEVALDINQTSAVSVRVHGDTAVLTGVLRQRGTHRGQPVDVTLRVTDTWVREGGQWHLLAGHAGRASEADTTAAARH